MVAEDADGGPSLAGTPDGPDDSGDVEAIRVLLLGVGEATRRQLEATAGFVVVDASPRQASAGAAETSEDGTYDVVMVSTRLPRNEAIALVGSHGDGRPVIALVHTGGEQLAADLVRAGARGLLAEGNETSVRSFLSLDGEDTGLLEVYDRQVGRTHVLGQARRSHDPVTKLPNAHAFDSRVAEAQLAGDVPRIGFVRLLFLQHDDPRTSADTVALIRRRLALQLPPIMAAHQVEMFSLSDATFAFLGPELSTPQAEVLGAALATLAAAFSPWGLPLAVAVGHAGVEVSEDPITVRQLAERAVDVATLEQRSTVVGAETLALGASSTTELEAALRLVDVVERHDPHGPGHAARVAELAASIAWELGYEGRAGAAIRLAAHLHDVGKISLPVEAMFGQDLSDDLEQLARSHPSRGADHLRPLVGSEIASAVRSHHERWDGTGFPDGLAGDQIPVASRITALAADYLRCARVQGHGAALALVIEQAGTAYDPSIVEAATPLLAVQGSIPALVSAR